MKSRRISKYFIFVILALFCLRTYALHNIPPFIVYKDTNNAGKKDSVVAQKDLIDFIGGVFKVKMSNKPDSERVKPGKILLAVFPAAGYALQSSWVAILACNVSFYTSSAPTYLSTITINPQYSIMHQVIIPITDNIWTKNNMFNFVGDIRFYKYPSFTYGLGSRTLLTNVDSIDFTYVKFYQEALIKIGKNLFGGIGYDLDYHWNIKDYGDLTDFQKYNENAPKTVSSGLVTTLKFDNRDNINNPTNSFYAVIRYRYNSTLMGSDNDWQSIQLEARKYFNLNRKGHDVLAFWSWNEITFGGKPPYLDLPSTGWDTYNNTGRGYIQGRFRGANMYYLEAEFRFNILRNGLLGGVLFSNAETVSRRLSDGAGGVISPGEGFGIRIKLNRYSNTNVAIDYGFGTGGSRGFFFNIGEVF